LFACETPRAEIERDMKLMGCRSVDQLSRDNLRFRCGGRAWTDDRSAPRGLTRKIHKSLFTIQSRIALALIASFTSRDGAPSNWLQSKRGTSIVLTRDQSHLHSRHRSSSRSLFLTVFVAQFLRSKSA
jgi:hypothetical protein